VLPPDRVVGKFSAPERTPSGWYQHPDDSLASVSVLAAGGPPRPLQHRDSFESAQSAQTGHFSVYMPRRVESIMGDEDRRKYELAQASQLSQFMSNSRLYQGPPPGQVYEFSDVELRRGGFTDVADAPLSSLGASSGGGSSGNRPTHRRLASSESFASGGSSSQDQQQQQQQQQQQPQQQGPPLLPLPSSTTARGARSPLGRASWLRPSTMDEVEAEIEMSNAEHMDGGIGRNGPSQPQPGTGTAPGP
jgi:chitin synthase